MKDYKRVNYKDMRQSNFELLRIIAMILIVVHHITCHCIKIQLEDTSLYALGECFNQTTFFKKLLFPQFFMAAGKIGNIVFVLIAGYFLINKEININRQIKKIISQLLLIVPVIVISSIIYYKLCSNQFAGIQTFNLINTDYWFIGFYVAVIVIAHIFLNKFLNKLEKKDYIKFLIILFTIITIAFLRNIISNISEGLTTLVVGIFIYSLGGFIRLYNPFKNVRAYFFILIIISSIIAICVNYYNDTLLKIIDAEANNVQGIYQQLADFHEYNIFCLLFGVSLFELFKRIKIKKSKIINYIASSTFMIYLIHDNDFFRNIWRGKNLVSIMFFDFNKFLLLCFIWIILIFIIGVLAYTLYCCFLKIIQTEYIKKIIFKNDIED